jgi:hypothetical protein
MINEPQITPEQARGARVLLGWVPRRVCRSLAITPSTLHRAENHKGKTGHAAPAVFAKLRRLYEAECVEFTNGGQPGVKLRALRTSAVPGGE